MKLKINRAETLSLRTLDTFEGGSFSVALALMLGDVLGGRALSGTVRAVVPILLVTSLLTVFLRALVKAPVKREKVERSRGPVERTDRQRS